MSIRVIPAVEIPDEDYGKLVRLARQRGIPVCAIVAGYIRLCLAGENLPSCPAPDHPYPIGPLCGWGWGGPHPGRAACCPHDSCWSILLKGTK